MYYICITCVYSKRERYARAPYKLKLWLQLPTCFGLRPFRKGRDLRQVEKTWLVKSPLALASECGRLRGVAICVARAALVLVEAGQKSKQIALERGPGRGI